MDTSIGHTKFTSEPGVKEIARLDIQRPLRPTIVNVCTSINCVWKEVCIAPFYAQVDMISGT